MPPLPVGALKTTTAAMNDLNPIAANRRCNDTGGQRTNYVRSEKRPEDRACSSSDRGPANKHRCHSRYKKVALVRVEHPDVQGDITRTAPGRRKGEGLQKSKVKSVKPTLQDGPGSTLYKTQNQRLWSSILAEAKEFSSVFVYCIDATPMLPSPRSAAKPSHVIDIC
jgi:hypothetical protein